MTQAFRNLIHCVILSGANDSNIISEHSDSAAMCIINNDVTGTLSIQVSHDGVTFATYQEGSTLADVTLPAVGKAAIYQHLAMFPFWKMRLRSNRQH